MITATQAQAIANLPAPFATLMQQDWPVLGSSIIEMAKQATRGERAIPADIATIVLRDPFFIMNVLRAVGIRKRGRLSSDITTIEHAIMMMGAKPFFLRFAQLNRVEDKLKAYPRTLLQLRRACSRAHHAACQARDWAIQRQDMESEETYIAAALFDIAEACLCLLAPESAAKLNQAMHSEPALTAAAQIQALGFDLSSLRLAIAQNFLWPEIIRDLTMAQADQGPRAQSVQLAADIARHAENGWYGEEINTDIAALAVLLRVSADEAMQHVHRTAALAARAWRYYLAPPAARWLPLLPEAATI